jgi:PAS domain S-box-containing protein
MVLSAITDVTERKLAEETRLHAEAKFRSLLEAAPDAMVVVNQAGRIVLVNNQAERLFGYARQEMLGSGIQMLVPEYFERNTPPIRGSSLSGPRVMMMGAMEDLFARRKDGVEFPVEISLSPIETEEGLLVSSAIRDVTARKLAAEQIMILNRQLERAAAEAESANLAKSTFLSTMSHEIRTPLNAILGYAQLMARDESLGAGAITNLKIIGRSGEHLLTLINDVLDMSKIEAGRLEINKTTFSLSRLLEDMGAMFRLRAASKALNFEMSMSGETVDYVLADEGKIRQMLINLLGNAIKFTQRGEIRLDVNLQQRGDGNSWLSVWVSDTGPGISEDEQQILFEPFSQSAGRLNIQEGTGLGLVISRRYARLMGGDITVLTTVGKGSTFLLEIPIERGDGGVVIRNLPERRVSGIQAGEERVKILVVDDRPENRNWLMQLLSSLGCEVRGSENGADAIKDWEEWSPRMILMDVHMPVMDGLEATRRIKADARGKDTRIVVLTASAMDDDRRRVAESGADDFLAKPCSENQLLQKMATLLDLTLEYADTPLVDHQIVSDAATLSAERLARLPLRLLEELRDATLGGDKKMLNKLIQQVRDLENSNSMQALANALSDLADKYQYDTLMRVLEEACQR